MYHTGNSLDNGSTPWDDEPEYDDDDYGDDDDDEPEYDADDERKTLLSWRD
ncbi:hypothetical protein FACS1894189_3600 [Planctomycetales bacterium]|nr:hypothetical protein FACS1894189_3600 [Planctomycetales bacterium]